MQLEGYNEICLVLSFLFFADRIVLAMARVCACMLICIITFHEGALLAFKQNIPILYLYPSGIIDGKL